VLAVIAAAVAVVCVIFALDALRDQQAYRSARPCVSAAVADRCIERRHVTIVKSERIGHRPTHYYLDITGPGAPSDSVELIEDAPVWYAARPGDDAVLWLWHGAVVKVSDAGADGETVYAPRLHVAVTISGAMAALACTVAFGLCALRVHDAASTAGYGWSMRLVPLLPIAALGAFGFTLGTAAAAQFGSVIACLISGAVCIAFGVAGSLMGR